MRPASAAYTLALLLGMIVLVPLAAHAQATFEDQIMEIVNQERWNNGQLAPLKRCDLLDTSTGLHSDNMAVRNFHAHCDPDTKTLPWNRMNAAGYIYNSAGENIAAGYTTPSAVMTAWMGSSGHRANILSTTFREIGIGYVYQSGDAANVRSDPNGDCTADVFNGGPYGHYWTQNFGRRNFVYPVIVNREAYESTSRDVSLYIYGAGFAVDMRIRNDAGTWSDWMPFATDKSWTLSPVNGARTVEVEIRNGATVFSASDTIVLDAVLTAVPADGVASTPGPVLRAPSPNPARAGARLSFELPRDGAVQLAVFDLAGRRVRLVWEGVRSAGPHEILWDGRNDAGTRPARGIYFVRLVALGEVRTTKILLGD
jgi:uncharacterized protein YkwD